MVLVYFTCCWSFQLICLCHLKGFSWFFKTTSCMFNLCFLTLELLEMLLIAYLMLVVSSTAEKRNTMWNLFCVSLKLSWFLGYLVQSRLFWAFFFFQLFTCWYISLLFSTKPLFSCHFPLFLTFFVVAKTHLKFFWYVLLETGHSNKVTIHIFHMNFTF